MNNNNNLSLNIGTSRSDPNIHKKDLHKTGIFVIFKIKNISKILLGPPRLKRFCIYYSQENGKHSNKQECIPVGCVPSAAVAVSPATHASTGHTCHPLPHMPPTTHAPYHTCPPPHMPPCHACTLCHTTPFTMHGPLCHAGPPFATHAPPMDRMTDTCENITFPQLLLQTVMMFID